MADAPGEGDEDALPPMPPPRRRWVMWCLIGILAMAAGAGLMTVVGGPRAAAPEIVAPTVAAAPPTTTPPLPPPVAPPAAAPPPARRLPPAPVAMGSLVVNSTPWAELFVDGKSVGNTPVVDLPLRAGTHRLRLVRDGFEPVLRTVVVPRNQTLRVTGIQLRESQP